MSAVDDARLAEQIRKGTGASSVLLGERLQSLWSGYGEIRRVELVGARACQAIVKSVTPPQERDLGRAAGKLRSHRRKLRSYAIELAFYRGFAASCAASCRVPALLHGEAGQGRFLFVFEDLDAAGFAQRRALCSDSEICACLSWLAAFHARFLEVAPEGLWQVGSYWHLATRPDELLALAGHELRRAAPRIDARLNGAHFRTLIQATRSSKTFASPKPGARSRRSIFNMLAAAWA